MISDTVATGLAVGRQGSGFAMLEVDTKMFVGYSIAAHELRLSKRPSPDEIKPATLKKVW